jgi:NAD(P)-dependent dehydrogenase (short-subunit alcohol dehydrogenase family)
MMSQVLQGKVALVAGATRAAGRGIAVELGAAGATVYCTGRSTRTQASELKRPESIEETAELVQQAGGQGIAVQVDHLDPAQVQALVTRIEGEQGRLDILVNDVWGADFLIEWNVPLWKHSLENGLRMLRLAIDTHIITSHFALPLLIKNTGGLVVEMTDGTAPSITIQITGCRCLMTSPRPPSFALPGRRRKSFVRTGALQLP